MTDELEPEEIRDAEPFDSVIVDPPTSADALEAQPRVLIPCPGDETKDCDSAALLGNGESAPWVFEYLDSIGDAERTAGEENNLGCALAWLGRWGDAAAAFARATQKNDPAVQERAARNLAWVKGADG